MAKACAICNGLRLIVVCGLSGAIVGYYAHQHFENNWAMAATFFAALIPYVVLQKLSRRK